MVKLRFLEPWQRNLLLLWIGCFATSASYSMVVPFLPLFLPKIGVHSHVELWSGLLFSSSFLAGALSGPMWGSMADKYGRKPMIVRAGLSLGALYFLTAFVHNPYELLALRLLQGFLAGFIPGSIALVGTSTPERNVAYALAMISTASSTGGILGPLMGGSISHWLGNRLAFASAGVIVGFAAIMVLLWVRETGFVPSTGKTSSLGAVKVSISHPTLRMLLILTLLTSFSVMTIEPVLPLYIGQLGGSEQNASFLAGIVFSLSGIASVVFAPQWGKLSQKLGFQRILLIGLAGGAVGNLAQLLFHHIVAFSIVRFIYGGFFCAVYPALNGMIVKATDSQFRGRAFSVNQTANQCGTMFGPIVGGAIGGAYSVHSVFWVTGILLLVTTTVSYGWGRKSPLSPASDSSVSQS